MPYARMLESYFCPSLQVRLDEGTCVWIEDGETVDHTWIRVRDAASNLRVTVPSRLLRVLAVTVGPAIVRQDVSETTVTESQTVTRDVFRAGDRVTVHGFSFDRAMVSGENGLLHLISRSLLDEDTSRRDPRSNTWAALARVGWAQLLSDVASDVMSGSETIPCDSLVKVICRVGSSLDPEQRVQVGWYDRANLRVITASVPFHRLRMVPVVGQAYIHGRPCVIVEEIGDTSIVTVQGDPDMSLQTYPTRDLRHRALSEEEIASRLWNQMADDIGDDRATELTQRAASRAESTGQLDHDSPLLHMLDEPVDGDLVMYLQKNHLRKDGAVLVAGPVKILLRRGERSFVEDPLKRRGWLLTRWLSEAPPKDVQGAFSRLGSDIFSEE